MDPSLDVLTLQAIQERYGSIDPNKLVTRRRQYYSFVKMPEAGQSITTFFGSSQGNSNRQLTNLMTPGQLDNPFVVKAYRMAYYINNPYAAVYSGTDASTLYSDLINGLFQCGILRVTIGGQEKLVLPSPFLYAPPANGSVQVHTAGNVSVTSALHDGSVAAGAVTDLTVDNTIVTAPPHADLCGRKDRAYIVDPYYLLEKQQSFSFTLEYPYGAVPVIGTGVTDDTSNPLYVGLYLDGTDIMNMQ